MQERISYREFISWIAYFNLESGNSYPQQKVTSSPAQHTGKSLAEKFRALTET